MYSSLLFLTFTVICMFFLLQNKPVSDLYKEVRRVTGKQTVMLFSDENLVEENNNQLQNEIFDGVKLTLSTTITLFVVVDKKYTIQISPVSIYTECYYRLYHLLGVK